MGIEVKDLLNVESAQQRTKVGSGVVNAIPETTTVLLISTKVTNGSVRADGDFEEATDIRNGVIL